MLLKQSTARNLMVFMADSSDHITGKTDLTLTITASKDGAAFASISPTVTERGSGWYSLALTTSHTDTLGDFAVHITGTGADATDISRQVVVQIPGDVMTANMTQINGSSTSSNLATLKLKSLNIQSDSPTTYALDINGYDGTIGTNDGGTAIRIRGGNPYSATGNGSGGHGILLSGGSVTGSGNRGYALRASASGAGGGGGIYIDGSWGQIPLLLQGDSYTSGMKVTGGYGWIGGIQANILGNFVGNVTGSVGSISSVRPKKNTGLDNFMFPMFDSTTKNPKTGLTVTAERSIDGNPFAPCSASAVELSNGVYRVSLSAGDLNGNKIMLRFSAPGADDQLVEIITQD